MGVTLEASIRPIHAWNTKTKNVALRNDGKCKDNNNGYNTEELRR